jgi:hypothetical protein
MSFHLSLQAGINLRYNCSPTPEHPGSPIVKPLSLSYCKNFHTTMEEFCSPEETIKGADVILQTSGADGEGRLI